MKQYKIGEIASLMNISKEMVRYYERCGIIKPHRLENNNYRLYSIMDLFSLLEATALAQFDVNMKDIQEIRNEYFTVNIAECYRNYLEKTEEQIEYLSLKRNKAAELLDSIETALFNLGHFWVKKVPPHYSYPFLTAHNDSYGDILAEKRNRDILSDHKYFPFLIPAVQFREEEEEWTLDMDLKYVSPLNMPHIENQVLVPEQYCYCSVIDMGRIGEFSREKMNFVIEKCHEEGYKTEGKPVGILLGRGIENGTFKRLMEIRVPLKV